MRSVARAVLQLTGLAVVAAAPLRAQDAAVVFGDRVTVRVASADSGRVARFALVGAGLSLTGPRTDLTLGDTVFLYTPATVTIDAYTERALIAASPGQPALRLSAVTPGRPVPHLYAEGRVFEFRQARAAADPATARK